MGLAVSAASVVSMAAITTTALSPASRSHLPSRVRHRGSAQPVIRRIAPRPRSNRSFRGSTISADRGSPLGEADPSGSEVVFGVGVIGGGWGGKGEGPLGAAVTSRVVTGCNVTSRDIT